MTFLEVTILQGVEFPIFLFIDFRMGFTTVQRDCAACDTASVSICVISAAGFTSVKENLGDCSSVKDFKYFDWLLFVSACHGWLETEDHAGG